MGDGRPSAGAGEGPMRDVPELETRWGLLVLEGEECFECGRKLFPFSLYGIVEWPEPEALICPCEMG